MSNTRKVRSLLRRTSEDIDEDVLQAIRNTDGTWWKIKRAARLGDDALCDSLRRLRREKNLIGLREDPALKATNIYEECRIWFIKE